MKILLTGATGFVGRNLSEFFTSTGYEVLGMSSREGLSDFCWDDLTAGRLPAVDAVFHLAGKAHDLKNQAEAEVYFEINTELTKKVFSWFLKSSAKQFYFFSSVKAAADFVSEGVLTEEVVPAPVGPYGESKIAAERFIRENFDFKKADDAGKRVYIIRPCMIHGPGNKGNLNLLYAVVKYGLPWPLGAFENRRSFLSVENLEFILAEMLKKQPPSGIYNVADDETLSTNDLVRGICAALGKQACIVNIPSGLVRLCASLGTCLHLPFNKERLNKLTENYAVSNRKIKQALGVDCLPVPVKEGIVRTITSFRERAGSKEKN